MWCCRLGQVLSTEADWPKVPGCGDEGVSSWTKTTAICMRRGTEHALGVVTSAKPDLKSGEGSVGRRSASCRRVVD